MKLIQLLEKRKGNLEKLTPAQELLKYEGRDDIFVHFSNIPNKVGINPRSKFDTPSGVYAYPIDFITSIIDENDGTVSNFFATNRPYMHILKSKGNVLNLENFNESIFKQTMIKVRGLPNLSIKDVDNAFDKAEEDADSVLSKQWWYFVHNIAERLSELLSKVNNVPIVWNKLLRQLGYDVIVDMGDEIIHENESFQAVFLSPKGYTFIDTIVNTSPPINVKAFTENNDIKSQRVISLLKEKKLLNVLAFDGCTLDVNDNYLIIRGGRIQPIHSNEGVIDIDYKIQLHNTTISDVRFKNSVVVNTDAKNCNIATTNINRSHLGECKLYNCRISLSTLKECDSSLITGKNLIVIEGKISKSTINDSRFDKVSTSDIKGENNNGLV